MSLNSLTRLLTAETKKCGLIFASVQKFSVTSTANMVCKEMMDPTIKKPKPWPYKTKKYTYFHFWESTLKRFDENTKVIVVDGNIGAGKTAFAKQLAEAFDMKYIPEPTMDRRYLTPYGYDLRQLDPIAPPTFKSCDINTFYKNPHDLNVQRFQFAMFGFRLEDYVDALAHVFNTGQGIVLERNPYSDFVFWQAMFKAGYISKTTMTYYEDVLKLTLEELLRPHLVIYLDISPEVALKRIKERNNPAEVNSSVLTHKYLSDIEYHYKQHYLKTMEPHCELLIYDWNNFGDVEVVVEDIERIDFDRFNKYDTKLKDWRLYDDIEFGIARRRYTNEAYKIMNYAEIFRPSATDLFCPTEDVMEYRSIMREKVPGGRYIEGFNADVGDNVWFKNYHKGYWYNPYTHGP